METGTPSEAGIACQVSEGIAWITLDRPQKRNALDIAARLALRGAIERAARQPEVRAIVLRGADHNFCAGGDVSTMRGERPMSTEEALERMTPIVEIAGALLEMPKPVVAAVDGVAYGGGFGLCLCADLVIATPRARLCASFARIGLVPDFLSSFTLPRIVGWQRAKELIYGGKEISGTEARALGIVAELAAPEDLEQKAHAMATALAAMSPIGFALTKQALLRSMSSELAAMATSELNGQSMALTTQFHQSAIESFFTASMRNQEK